MWFFIKNTSTAFTIGYYYYYFKTKYLEPFGIPINDEITKAQVVILVQQILSIIKNDDYVDTPDKQAKVKRLEKEIDQLVYELYDLTPEEIRIVEEFCEK